MGKSFFNLNASIAWIMATEGGNQETQREHWATMHEALRSIVAQSWLVSGSQPKLLTVAGAAEEDTGYHLTSHLT